MLQKEILHLCVYVWVRDLKPGGQGRGSTWHVQSNPPDTIWGLRESSNVYASSQGSRVSLTNAVSMSLLEKISHAVISNNKCLPCGQSLSILSNYNCQSVCRCIFQSTEGLIGANGSL